MIKGRFGSIVTSMDTVRKKIRFFMDATLRQMEAF